jgi:ABC-2 type transport system permease protein
MNGMRQSRLVAVRELRERSRSRAFRASLVIMVVVVIGVIVLPALISSSGRTKDVGLTGSVPALLPDAIKAQGDAAGVTTHVRRYRDLAAGEAAVRNRDIDVLVVGARRLEWPRRVDEQLRGIVTGAIQLVAVRERAAAAGISPAALATVLAPVRIGNVELGSVPGRGPDDETAAFVMTVVLFMAIATYGSMVLAGVVEEKTSRIVEVLLARMPARNLLAGKVTGIGLLGLAQIAVTALAALIATVAVKSVDLPAVRGSVLAWTVVWFVLGYALYAMVYGVLGSLASRPEDAQSVSAPVTVVLIAGYFASFAAIGTPDGALARLVSFFPPTAPLAMPGRIAMGVTSWWEPVVAAALTVATIIGLADSGGRVYAAAILHSGPTLKLRAAWRSRHP